jgi:hypothetical protein
VAGYGDFKKIVTKNVAGFRSKWKKIKVKAPKNVAGSRNKWKKRSWSPQKRGRLWKLKNKSPKNRKKWKKKKSTKTWQVMETLKNL